MITNERAIELLMALQEPEAWESQITDEAYEALEMAINAVKLQIPQKPEKLKVTENLTYLICPVCRKSEVAIRRRCPCCGQAIDWSDYDFSKQISDTC